MVVLTNLGRMVGFFSLCFFIIGFIHSSSLMYMMGLFCIMILLGSLLMAWSACRGVECQRDLTHSVVFSGDPLEGSIQLKVRNRRWRWLEIYDRHTNLLTGNIIRRGMTLLMEGGGDGVAVVAGARQTVTDAGNGARLVEVSDSIRFPRRGRYLLGPLIIRSCDPFGMLHVSRSMSLEQGVIVYPHPLPMPELMLAGVGGRKQHDITPVGRVGEEIDFHGIRPYVQGDDLRRVHWKATAHSGKLAIKEFEYRSSGSAQVILDLQRVTHAGEEENSTLEAAVTLAVSVLNHTLDVGNQAGLFATGMPVVSLPQDSGRRQLHRIMETLALAQDDGMIPLAQALASDEAQRSHRATAIVITATTDMGIIGPLLSLRGRSAQVLLVLLNPRSFHDATQELRKPRNLLDFGLQPIDLKKGLKAITTPSHPLPSTDDHLALLHAAAAAGIDVYSVNADTPLHLALQGIHTRI